MIIRLLVGVLFFNTALVMADLFPHGFFLAEYSARESDFAFEGASTMGTANLALKNYNFLERKGNLSFNGNIQIPLGNKAPLNESFELTYSRKEKNVLFGIILGTECGAQKASYGDSASGYNGLLEYNQFYFRSRNEYINNTQRGYLGALSLLYFHKNKSASVYLNGVLKNQRGYSVLQTNYINKEYAENNVELREYNPADISKAYSAGILLYTSMKVFNVPYCAFAQVAYSDSSYYQPVRHAFLAQDLSMGSYGNITVSGTLSRSIQKFASVSFRLQHPHFVYKNLINNTNRHTVGIILSEATVSILKNATSTTNASILYDSRASAFSKPKIISYNNKTYDFSLILNPEIYFSRWVRAGISFNCYSFLTDDFIFPPYVTISIPVKKKGVVGIKLESGCFSLLQNTMVAKQWFYFSNTAKIGIGYYQML